MLSMFAAVCFVCAVAALFFCVAAQFVLGLLDR